MNEGRNSQPTGISAVFSSTVLRVAGAVGCLTLVIIFASLVGGLLLDQLLNTRPLFTILLLVASMPLTWVVVFRVVNQAKDTLLHPPAGGEKTKYQEEDERDES